MASDGYPTEVAVAPAGGRGQCGLFTPVSSFFSRIFGTTPLAAENRTFNNWEQTTEIAAVPPLTPAEDFGAVPVTAVEVVPEAAPVEPSPQADSAACAAAETLPASVPNLPTGPPPWRQDPVFLQIIPEKNMDCAREETAVLVRVQSPSSAERVPSCLVCVLDVSGSMGAEATLTSAGVTERHGLNLMDVAKHGIRTVINTLSDQDQLCIVTFNHMAATVLPITVMDEAGRKMAAERLSELRPGGGTNLWNGLFEGLEALRKVTLKGCLGHIVLLSDGESNQRESIMPNLVQYKAKYERLPGTISTFGFGYCIDSMLLGKLAQTGNGSYGFIPDASFIGTVFVNCMSNLLVTFAREVSLSIEPEDGCEIVEVLGSHEVEIQSWGIQIKLGMLQYQQSRDIVLLVTTAAAGPYMIVAGQHEPLDRAGASPEKFTEVVGPTEGNRKEVIAQRIRCGLVDAIAGVEDTSCSIRAARASISSQQSANDPALLAQNASAASPSGGGPVQRKSLMEKLGLRSSRTSESLGNGSAPSRSSSSRSIGGAGDRYANRVANMKQAKERLLSFTAQLKPELALGDPLITAIHEDVTGQMSEAVSCAEYYEKWGRHYMPSVMFAHRMQQCNNFKDPGVQLYGGALFGDLRDVADDIFCQLPAPEPTSMYSGGMARAGAPISMAAYNDRSAG